MSKIRKAARGQECQVRIPGVCNFDTETTVLAHRPGGPIGGKNPDYQGSFCCSACHDVVDHRANIYNFDMEEITFFFHQGVFRTQEILREIGLINIKE